MDTPLTESEADTLFTQSRSGGINLAQPLAHDSFMQFLGLMNAAKAPPGEAVLVCRPRPDAAPATYVIGEKLTLGKKPDCTIAEPEIQTLSRLHFTIRRTTGGYELTDHSSNGTFLYPGTVRLPRDEPYLLKQGDLLWVEGMVLAFLDASA